MANNMLQMVRPNLPMFDWTETSAESGGLCVMGAVTDRGCGISRGAAHGATAIRRASHALRRPRLSGIDWGDIGKSGFLDLNDYLSAIAEMTALAQTKGLCPLLLGGDHSISYASISTIQQSRDLCLIWFDAHTDFSHWSGNGSHNHKQVLRRIASLDGVRQIVQIGYRGITTDDERYLGEKAVVITTAEARELGAQGILDRIPYHLSCYISIDIDVIDPLWAPGTSAPVPDGLLPAEVREILRYIVRNRKVLGADLVEVNPTLDVRGATSRVAAALVYEIADGWCPVSAS